eukprot:scaffold9517_cov200-Amphora_coffeaeformis.AAC.3
MLDEHPQEGLNIPTGKSGAGATPHGEALPYEPVTSDRVDDTQVEVVTKFKEHYQLWYPGLQPED